MSLKMKKVFISWCFSLFLVFAVVAGAQAYSSILSFGDSLSDNGQWEYSTAVSPLDGRPFAVAGNTNPYDRFGFGTFSAGKVWVEYLAQNLGTTSTPLPLLDMAYGGATSGWDAPAAGSTTMFGLQWQVATYKGSALLQSAFGINNALVTISAGGNDMFNGRSAADAAANVALAIQNLINAGGKTFLVENLIITPSSAVWATEFDNALSMQLSILDALNAGVDLYILDWNKVDLTGLALNDIMMPDGIHPTTDHQKRIAAIPWTSVPEPASIILMILGFAGLAGVRRRMK